MTRSLNPPRVVATWAVEQYWAEEYALRDKIIADIKRVLDSIPDRVPYPTDVFPWEAANMYRRESAVRVYRRRCDADRFAEKSDPALNLVVRSLDREVRS